LTRVSARKPKLPTAKDSRAGQCFLRRMRKRCSGPALRNEMGFGGAKNRGSIKVAEKIQNKRLTAQRAEDRRPGKIRALLPATAFAAYVSRNFQAGPLSRPRRDPALPGQAKRGGDRELLAARVPWAVLFLTPAWEISRRKIGVCLRT